MLGDRRARHVEMGGDLARAQLTVADERENCRRRGAAIAFSERFWEPRLQALKREAEKEERRKHGRND